MNCISDKWKCNSELIKSQILAQMIQMNNQGLIESDPTSTKLRTFAATKT